MFIKMKNRKGQSTLEYAVLVVIVIAALLTLQTYVKRGVQGKLKSSTDDIGGQFSTTGNSNWIKQTNTFTATRETVQNGLTESRLTADKIVNTQESMNLVNESNEWWGQDAGGGGNGGGGNGGGGGGPGGIGGSGT